MALRDYVTPTLRVRGESLRHRLTAAPPLFEESRSCKTTERLNTDNATVIFKLLSPQKGFKDVGEKNYVLCGLLRFSHFSLCDAVYTFSVA